MKLTNLTNRTQNLGRHTFAAPFCGLALLLGINTATAALIGLDPGAPDMTANSLGVNYDSTSGAFSIGTSTGSFSFAPDGTNTQPFPGSLDPDYLIFSINVNTSGVLQSGTNTFEVRQGGVSGTIILGGDIFAFGFEFIETGNTSTGTFDARFNISNADPLLGYGDSGVFIARVPNLQTGLGGSVTGWTADFSSTALGGTVDIAGPVVPVPPTLLLLAPALIGLGLRRHLRGG